MNTELLINLKVAYDAALKVSHRLRASGLARELSWELDSSLRSYRFARDDNERADAMRLVNERLDDVGDRFPSLR